jgi:hypothetical protein
VAAGERLEPPWRICRCCCVLGIKDASRHRGGRDDGSEEQTRDVIVLLERVLSDWWRADGHRLVLADLDEVIEEPPERLLVGTGAYGQLRPDPEALEQLGRRGV